MKLLNTIIALALLSTVNNLFAQSLPFVTTTTIDFVPVGDPGNAPDITGYGSVADLFQIGKTDITVEQYCAFLNAVASTDTYGLYDQRMESDHSVSCIQRLQRFYGCIYVVIPNAAHPCAQLPIIYVNWLSAARFCNWLQNGQPSGNEGPGTTETGSYNLNGATNLTDSSIFQVTPGATYFLPTENQWYKAAYYKGGSTNAGYWAYPTQSDDAPGNSIGDSFNQANLFANGLFATGTNTLNLTPVGSFTGSAGAYGTYDMGGDVCQWFVATDDSGMPSSAGFRGGDWSNPAADTNVPSFYENPSASLILSSLRDTTTPNFASGTIGFRVAAKVCP